MPTNFVATFKLYKPTGYGTAWVEIGSDANNNIFGGCVGGSGYLGTYVRVNNNYTCTDYKQNVFGNSTTSDVEFKCENGVATTKANNQTATCNYAITARSYQKIALVDGAKISNLLIMPL